VSGEALEIRAQRLLRCYPRRWREQYGEEFAELLVAELSEQDSSWRRTADVIRGGLVVRLSLIGLAGSPIGAAQAAVGSAAVALVAFLGCGLSLWTQLLTGWRWSSLDAHDLRFGVLAMSVAGVYLAVIALLACAPVVATLARLARVGEIRRVAVPLAIALIGAACLVAGGQHLQHAWPGAAGHGTHLRRLVPSDIAGFGWAETLPITAYWIHPDRLLALPRAQVAWIFTSPMLLVATVSATVAVVSEVPLSVAVLRYEARLAQVAAAGMALFLLAAAWWVLASRTAGNPVFKAGSLDLLLLVVMAAALGVAATVSRQLRRA
jgi:hypothetical protein